MARAAPAALTDHLATLATSTPGDAGVLAALTTAAVTMLCEDQRVDRETLVKRTARCFVGLLQVQCNGVAVLPPPTLGPPAAAFFEQAPPLGMALFSTLSMVNHSCRPSCHVSFHWHASTGLTAALRAIRPVAAGEEICISYGPQVGERITAARQRALQQQYGFVCGCCACTGACW